MRRPASKRVPFGRIEELESRVVPTSGVIAAGTLGGAPRVVLTDIETGTNRGSFFAYDQSFTGGVNVAMGDVTGDGPSEVVTGTGAGGAPHVKAFGPSGQLLRSFFAYGSNVRTGVNVAAGDVNGDGYADIITGAGPGAAPHVKVFSGATGAELASFFAFGSTFTGGVRVAAGDVNGDGYADIITGAAGSGSPHVKVFNGKTGAELASFFAFGSGQVAGGVYVAAGDSDGDGKAEIYVGAGAGGGPVVRQFSGTGQAGVSFLAFDAATRTGVQVGTVDLGESLQIVASQPGSAQVRSFTAAGVSLGTSTPFGAAFTGAATGGGAATLLGPVLHAGSNLGTSFVDPSAIVSRADKINIGHKSYVAPFVVLDASHGSITIGDGTNVQDNVELTANAGGIEIGDEAILAHNVTVLGDSTIGKVHGLPCFVGFNSIIESAIVEEDAFVGHLVKIAPGIIIRSGTKVLNGKFIQTQAEADNPAFGKVTAVTQGERDFMHDVLHVNHSFAEEYPHLIEQFGINAVRGIGLDPGHSNFNATSEAPTLHDTPTAAALAAFRNRIIGDVHAENTLAELDHAMGNRDSIRADEGPLFELGSITSMDDRTTFHALEHTEIAAGNHVTYGYHVVVHGGPDSGNTPHELTTIEDNVTIGDWAVVFRSTIGAGSSIGFRAYVDGSQLAPGTVVPDRAIIVDNVLIGFVEW